MTTKNKIISTTKKYDEVFLLSSEDESVLKTGDCFSKFFEAHLEYDEEDYGEEEFDDDE